MTHDEIKAKLEPLLDEALEIERRPLPTLEDEERLDAVALEVGVLYGAECQRSGGTHYGQLRATFEQMWRIGLSRELNAFLDWALARNFQNATPAARAQVRAMAGDY